MKTQRPIGLVALACLAAPGLAGTGDVSETEALDELGAGFAISSRDFTPAAAPESCDACCCTEHGPHAPIGVMGDHVHPAGEWMLSVRAMHMRMDGLSNNGRDVSRSELFAQGYMVAPLEMDMDMLMIGGMYGVTDRLTLTAMVPWIENSMDHVTGGGTHFELQSSGLGDVQLGGLLKLTEQDGHEVHLNLGVSLPTGSITERDDTPMMSDAKLAYPMQLGTGTFDLLPGLTYLGGAAPWSWGGQSRLRLHLGENDQGYRYGNRIDATGWLTRHFGAFEASARVAAAHWGEIQGADSDLNPMMVPTADTGTSGGDRVDGLLGFAWTGHASGNRLAVEVGAPAYQDLNGPALGADWTLSVGWQLLR